MSEPVPALTTTPVLHPFFLLLLVDPEVTASLLFAGGGIGDSVESAHSTVRSSHRSDRRTHSSEGRRSSSNTLVSGSMAGTTGNHNDTVTTTYVSQTGIIPPPRFKRKAVRRKVSRRNSKRREIRVISPRKKVIGHCVCS